MKNVRSCLFISTQLSRWLFTLLIGCLSLAVSANEVSQTTSTLEHNSQSSTMQLSAEEAVLIQMLRYEQRTQQKQTANAPAIINNQEPITFDGVMEAVQGVIQMMPNVNQKFEALNNDGVTPERWHEALSAYEEFLTIVADHSRYMQGDGKAAKRDSKSDDQRYRKADCVNCKVEAAQNENTLMPVKD